MLRGIFRAISERLQNSTRVHLRQERVTSPKEIVALVDRFIDDRLNYPLEWDDYISWSNSNSFVEAIREQIAVLEPLLLSKDKKVKAEASAEILKIRNHYAQLLGLPNREYPE